MAREDVRRWLRKDDAADAALRLGLHRHLRAGARRSLLDGKRVATHWASCARLAEKFPALTVGAEALYVVDGKIWTSAGVTTGVDMALALVEERTLARRPPT